MRNGLLCRVTAVFLHLLALLGSLGHSQDLAAVPDPSDSATSGYCYYNYVWNGTRARVYHPPNGGCKRSVYSPLVIILHAAGTVQPYTHTDYDFLQRHLARNGFISASVDVLANGSLLQDHVDAASEVQDFLYDFLWSNWSKRFYINPNSIALIGHSRGGETVRHLAKQLAADDLFRVRSVVSMAPASPRGDPITGLDTVGHLLLYGTRDFDTPPTATFREFDVSGSNGSQLDPEWDSSVNYKAMKLLTNGAHTGYSDLGTPEQKSTVKGYILAFLSAHNKNDVTWYEDYIRGEQVPGDWPPPVFTSYSDGFLRRVIDNFDDGYLAKSTLDGEVATHFATAHVLDLAAFGAIYVHDTHALWAWGSRNGSSVTWTIPALKRDTSAFKWLSLRIAQTSGPASDDLRIQLRNGTRWSPELRLTDYGAIPQPTEMCFIQDGDACSMQQHMATIRVPLADFGRHDEVQFVRIRFRGDSVPHTFIFDNIEFSEWIYKP